MCKLNGKMITDKNIFTVHFNKFKYQQLPFCLSVFRYYRLLFFLFLIALSCPCWDVSEKLLKDQLCLVNHYSLRALLHVHSWVCKTEQSTEISK